jgi:potassium efflux system protein
LERRQAFLQQHKDDQIDLAKLTKLTAQYQAAISNVDRLNQRVLVFRGTLDQALQYELSSRQGLPGFSGKAWLDLGEEILLVPTLGFQVVKSLTYTFVDALHDLSYEMVLLIGFLEIAWLMLAIFSNHMLLKLVNRMPEHEEGHVNLKRLCIQLLQNSVVDIALIGNIVGLFGLLGIPTQNSTFLIDLALVWLFFKVIITMARLCLVETAHDHRGHDVRLYHRLKWTFLVGGIITALTVFMHQLPVIYEVQDLFERLFLCFLLVVSVFLLKSWEVLPGLILPHIDDRRPYFKKVVLMLGLLIPLILLVNSAMGLFGYVNLVLTITWYESIFLFIMVGYLVIKGLLSDVMMFASTLFIRHSVNGWLWTEAFLKPIDKVLRIALFLSAWVALFLWYGWDKQSPVVERLAKLLHYQLVNVLNTTITPFSVLELAVVISLLFWTGRWTREFMYRLLISRTQDNGLRNSIAIFSQYAMILVGILIGLRVLGIDFKALGVVAGAFAIGISFGLRDLANNFVCGFLLLIERPVRVGDTVTIDIYEGEVTHIGGRAVTIRTWDHMEVLVPNAEIFSKSFTNWTAKDHVVRTVFAIKINRHDSPHDVQIIIHEALASHPNVLADPAAEVLLKELSDALIEFEVRYYVNLRHVKSRIGVRSEVLMAIWDAFDANGIKPPYPHHEIHVQNSLQTLPAVLKPAFDNNGGRLS